MDSRRGKRRRRRAGFCAWSNHQAALTAASKPPTVSLVLPNHHAWRHPWLRVQLVIRALTGTRWDAQQWPVVKSELGQVLIIRERMRRWVWWS